MEDDQLDRGKWTGERRAALVVKLLRGETSPEEASQRHGVTFDQLQEWKSWFLTGSGRAHDPRARYRLA